MIENVKQALAQKLPKNCLEIVQENATAGVATMILGRNKGGSEFNESAAVLFCEEQIALGRKLVFGENYIWSKSGYSPTDEQVIARVNTGKVENFFDTFEEVIELALKNLDFSLQGLKL